MKKLLLVLLMLIVANMGYGKITIAAEQQNNVDGNSNVSKDLCTKVDSNNPEPISNLWKNNDPNAPQAEVSESNKSCTQPNDVNVNNNKDIPAKVVDPTAKPKDKPVNAVEPTTNDKKDPKTKKDDNVVTPAKGNTVTKDPNVVTNVEKPNKNKVTKDGNNVQKVNTNQSQVKDVKKDSTIKTLPNTGVKEEGMFGYVVGVLLMALSAVFIFNEKLLKFISKS